MNLLTDDVPRLGLKSMLRWLDTTIECGVTPHIFGPPGVGKSATVAEYAASRGYTLCARHWGQYAVNNAMGVCVPDMDTLRSGFTLPDYLGEVRDVAGAGGRPLLFLDEAASADRAVAAVTNQIVHERRVGEHELPESCVVVLASNRRQDGAHAMNMVATTANRLASAVFEGANVDEFVSWGEATGRLAPEVCQFLRQSPEHLHSFDQRRAINATHRTWEDASKMLAACRGSLIGDTEMIMMLGTVIPRQIAAEMAVVVAIGDKLVPIGEIVDDPGGAAVPAERGDLERHERFVCAWLQVRFCIQRLADDVDEARAIACYIQRFEPEQRAAFVTMLTQRNGQGLCTEDVMGAVNEVLLSDFLRVVKEAL